MNISDALVFGNGKVFRGTVGDYDRGKGRRVQACLGGIPRHDDHGTPYLGWTDREGSSLSTPKRGWVEALDLTLGVRPKADAVPLTWLSPHC